MRKVKTNKKGFKKTSFSFYEKQKFRNKLIPGFLILIEFILIYALIEQELSNRLWGMKPVNTWMLVSFIMIIAFPGMTLFFSTRLETIINDDGIFYRWRPYKKSYNIYDWSAITGVSIIEVKGALFGWGRSKKYGELHYTGTRFAIRLEMKNGKQKVIGTGKPEELNRILSTIAGEKYSNPTGYEFDYS